MVVDFIRAPPSLSVQRRKATLAHPMPRESREESITSAEADGAREVGGGIAAAHARRSLAGAIATTGTLREALRMSEDQIRQTIVDQEHLNLLSIAYLVSAALSACFSLLGLVYAFMGAFFAAAIARMPATPGQAPPPAFMGWLFGLIGLGMFVFVLTIGGLK